MINLLRIFTTLLLAIFFCTNQGYAQTKGQDRLSQQNVITLNFCEGVSVYFVDVIGEEIDHAQIARWENAYNSDGSLNPDFKDLDDERFFLEVLDPDENGSTVTVSVDSFKK